MIPSKPFTLFPVLIMAKICILKFFLNQLKNQIGEFTLARVSRLLLKYRMRLLLLARVLVFM